MELRLDLLDETISKTARLIEGAPPDQLSSPTPCTDYTVGDLLDHLVGWVHIFEAATNDLDIERDPDRYLVESERRATVFERAGHAAVAGLRRHGVEREMRMVQNSIPGTMVLNMMTMEYPGHGWDLAVATDQPVPYTDEEAITARQAAADTIPPEYRGFGEGQFHPPVQVESDASPIEELVAFLGRDPKWTP